MPTSSAVSSLIAASSQFDWPLTVALVLGMGLGFFVVWAVTRHMRRLAHENAAELIEVARREAAVAAEEIKQRPPKESDLSTPNSARILPAGK